MQAGDRSCRLCSSPAGRIPRPQRRANPLFEALRRLARHAGYCPRTSHSRIPRSMMVWCTSNSLHGDARSSRERRGRSDETGIRCPVVPAGLPYADDTAARIGEVAAGRRFPAWYSSRECRTSSVNGWSDQLRRPWTAVYHLDGILDTHEQIATWVRGKRDSCQYIRW